MAPPCSGITVEVPRRSVGRLIGERGARVQELERETGCRVRSSEGRAAAGIDEEERPLTRISVRCTSSGAVAAREAREARCVRAVQLLCLEAASLSLAEALAQADAEREEYERLEMAHQEERQQDMAVRRILINWSDFDEEDVRAALQEACNGEDEAIDLLHSGFHAPPRPRAQLQRDSAAAMVKEAHSEVAQEDFPLLAGMATLHCDSGSWVGARRSAQRRGGPAPSPSELGSCEEFPGLPTRPRQAPLPCNVSVGRNGSGGGLRIVAAQRHRRRA